MTRLARTIAVISRLVLVLALSGCSSVQEILHPPYSQLPRLVSSPSIVFISDTQAPLGIETLWQTYDDNEVATEKIFEAIERDTQCAAVFHLGDITAAGSIDSYWHGFDDATQGLREAGIPLYPAFGNHEYMVVPGGGEENTLRRFPFLSPSWYQRRIGSVAVLILNSNFSQLTPDERHAQGEWYERTLRELDADSSVAIVLVGCHHPPYTNSKVVEPDVEVQGKFVPAFIRSEKAQLFLSGHAHAFEHFRISGKDFLVIGGAGGLLHPLLQGTDRRYEDLFVWQGERRFFHYVRLSIEQETLSVNVMRLVDDKTSFEIAHELRISLKR
ncbi:MAG: metallophosphoesterase family protein [Bacteroidota bacterium]